MAGCTFTSLVSLQVDTSKKHLLNRTTVKQLCNHTNIPATEEMALKEHVQDFGALTGN